MGPTVHSTSTCKALSHTLHEQMTLLQLIAPYVHQMRRQHAEGLQCIDMSANANVTSIAGDDSDLERRLDKLAALEESATAIRGREAGRGGGGMWEGGRGWGPDVHASLQDTQAELKTGQVIYMVAMEEAENTSWGDAGGGGEEKWQQGWISK